MAHAFGMTLGDLLGWPRPMGHLEFLVTHRWLEMQWNAPNRTDWYLMQNTAEIRAFRRSFGGGDPVRLSDMQIPFPKPTGVKRPTTRTTSTRRPAHTQHNNPYTPTLSQEDWWGEGVEEEVASPYPDHVKVVRVKKDRLRPGAEGKTPAQLEAEAKLIEATWLLRMGFDSKGRPKDGGAPLQKREPGQAQHNKDAGTGKVASATPPVPTPKQRKPKGGH